MFLDSLHSNAEASMFDGKFNEVCLYHYHDETVVVTHLTLYSFTQPIMISIVVFASSSDRYALAIKLIKLITILSAVVLPIC